MEHNKAFRNRSTHILDQLTFKEHTKVQWEKKQSFQKMCMLKLEIKVQKNDTQSLCHTVHKNQLKMYYRLHAYTPILKFETLKI